MTQHNAGIYEIVNTVNGKRYVGSAVNFIRRFNAHRSTLNRGKHHNIHLQQAWKKHGATAFEFRRLLICASQNLLLYEQIVLDATQPQYNLAPTAGSSFGVKHSAEARAKASERMIGNQRAVGAVRSEQQREKMRGNKHGEGYRHTEDARQRVSERLVGNGHATGSTRSAEFKANLSAKLTGKKRAPFSDAARANMSASRTGKARPSTVVKPSAIPIDVRMKLGRMKPDQVRAIRSQRGDGMTIKAIAVAHNVSPTQVWRVCSRQNYEWIA